MAITDMLDNRDAIARRMVPVVTAPAYGSCPDYEAALSVEDGHCFVLTNRSLILAVRRPWLEANIELATFPVGIGPFGEGPTPGAVMLCGTPPASILTELRALFEAALPNEAAAFVTWSKEHGWRVRPAKALASGPSHINYEMPALGEGEFPVVDSHSHGRLGAYFSSQDNSDDAGSTKCAIVFGRLTDDEPEIALRLMVMGMPHPLTLDMFGPGDKPFRTVAPQRSGRSSPSRPADPGDAIVASLANSIVSAALSRAGMALIEASAHHVCSVEEYAQQAA